MFLIVNLLAFAAFHSHFQKDCTSTWNKSPFFCPPNEIGPSVSYERDTRAINPYPWILEKRSKTRDRSRARFPEKIQSAVWHHGFFSGKRGRWQSQKMANIFVQHGIFALILAYAIWNLHQSQYFLSLNCDVTSEESGFFPENTLGYVPKKRVRVKG